MDINPQKMDELFQRAAEGFRPEAPEHSWPEIEKRIRRKKKKGIGFWLSIASLFFIVGGAGAWMGLSSNSTTPAKVLDEKTTSTSNKSRVLATSSESSTEPSSIISTSNSQSSSSKNASATSESTTFNASEKSDKPAQKTGTETNSSSKSSSKKAGISNGSRFASLSESSNSTSKTTKKNRTARPSKLAISGMYTPPQVLEEDLSKKFDDQVSNQDVQQKPLFFASLNSKTPRLNLVWDSNPMKIIIDEDPSATDRPNKNLFDQMPGPSWGMVFQPEYVNNWEQLRTAFLQDQNGNPVVTQVNPNFRSSLNSLNHNVGFSVALQSRFTIDVKTSFDLGLSYGFRNDRQNYFECFNAGTGESKLHYQPLVGWSSTPQTFENSYHYISLPVGMTHALTGNVKSTGFRLHWNLVPQVLVAGQSMTFDFAKDGFVTGAISSHGVYRRTGLSAGLGLGYAVKMNARALLETGIQWNGNWSTLFNEYYPVDKRFGAIGARVGVVFK